MCVKICSSVQEAIMEQEEFEALLQFFRVVGNESRLKILGLLSNQGRCVGELASMLDLKEPTVSHHLTLMKNLGLVSAAAVGNAHIYRLETQFLAKMSEDLFGRAKLADLADSIVGDSWEQKVLQNFLDGQRIKAIPAQYKKRMVLVRWMLGKFKMGVRYSEREVNEIIKQHHEDTAWFRRTMVDHKLMAREQGIYWRLPSL